MKTIFRNATNRILFKLRDNPERFVDVVAFFRQNDRIVLQKRKREISIYPFTDDRGCQRWMASVLLSPEESMRFQPGGIGFAQIIALRSGGVQDPGEIYEFDICDTIADNISLEAGEEKRWQNDPW